MTLCLQAYRTEDIHQQKNKVPDRAHSAGKAHKPFPGLTPPTAKEFHLQFLWPPPAHLGQVRGKHSKLIWPFTPSYWLSARPQHYVGFLNCHTGRKKIPLGRRS